VWRTPVYAVRVDAVAIGRAGARCGGVCGLAHEHAARQRGFVQAARRFPEGVVRFRGGGRWLSAAVGKPALAGPGLLAYRKLLLFTAECICSALK